MELEFWATTDVGRVRDHNEDNFLVDKRLKLFVVCDGMGGHAAGEVASAMAVKIVRERIAENREVFSRIEDDPENIAFRKAVMAVCESAISEACQKIFLAAVEDPAKKGMGTTCSMLLLRGNRGFIGHVGDSRIYLLRNNQVHQITEDHSLINEMIRLGKIQPGEEHKIPNKNAVTRAVGVNEFVEVDTFQLELYSGDQFLLCSDGLCGYFKSDDDIIDLLDTEDPREATERCITFANDGGGKDNITSIVVRVQGDDDSRDIQKTMETLRATPYFQYLSYKEMVQIVNMTERLEFGTGDVIREESASNDTMYLIVQGSVEVTRKGIEVGVFEAAQHLGDSALIDEDARPYKAVALADTVLLAIRRTRFMELLRVDSELAVKLLWNFVQTFAIRMRESEVAYETQKAKSEPEHTPPSGVLVFEEDKNGHDLHDEPPLHIGDEMGSDEETIDLDGFNRDALAAAMEGDEPSAPEEDNPAHAAFRETVKLASADEATQTMPALSRAEVERDAQKSGAISGTSQTQDDEAPKAQVMKRSKLVIGASSAIDDEEAGEDDVNQEAASLAERLKKRAQASSEDATVNVEDAN